jgi:MFS transporter, ACS family, D-galactonate transporter
LTRSQWVLLILLVASIFLNYVDRSNLSLAAPLIEREFSLGPSAMGRLFAAFFWTYALLQLFGTAGWLADRFPVGRVLAGGLFVWSAATILTGVLTGFSALFAMRLLVGAGESLAYPCYSRLFAMHIPSHSRGRANALLDAASKLGPALGTLAGGALLVRTGWRAFFIVLGVASLLWLAPWFRWMPRSANLASAGMAAGPRAAQILGTRSAWGAFLGHFCGNYFWFFLLTWLPDYLVKARGLTMDRMVGISSIAYFIIAGSTLAAGWLSDRRILRGEPVTRVRKSTVVFGLSFSAIILPAGSVRNESFAMLLLFLACVGFGIYTSNHWAITQTLAGPLAAGRWTSLQNGIGNLSGIAAAWLTGWAVDRTHSFVPAFILAAAVTLTGALMWGLVVGPVEPVKWEKAR